MGRVVGGDRDQWTIRTQHRDITLAVDGAAVRVGDLVEVHHVGGKARLRVVSGPFEIGCETTRLTRARLDALYLRSQVLAQVRGYFHERGFLEVETPLRVPSPGLEVHIDAVCSEGRWLIASPEQQMKRLLASGLERIFTICKCFRRGELGEQHNPEFTMLEWYRGYAVLGEVLQDMEQLVARTVWRCCGKMTLSWRGRPIDMTPPWQHRSVSDAFREFGGIDLLGNETSTDLAQKIRSAGIDVGDARAWDDLFYVAFVEAVEPGLAKQAQPVVLYDWPIRLSALAQKHPTNPRVVERFEVYAAGLELANAFGELTDAAEQRRRFQTEQKIREQRGFPIYPIDEKFLAALEQGIPPSAGVALGVDRLAMLVAEAESLVNVLAFAEDEL